MRSQFFYLYLIIDTYSRKIVGHEVFDAKNMANNATVVQRTVLRKQCRHEPLVLHAGNGPAMKGATLHVRLEELGIAPSHSRPRVSNDNAYSEALFKTRKYRPEYPADGFTDIAAARRWVAAFVVAWYNTEHRHSEIRYITPAQRHPDRDAASLAARREALGRARARNPGRWSRGVCNCQPVGTI